MMLAVRRTLGLVLVVAVHLAWLGGCGLAVAVFSTNPPPRAPGQASDVDFWRYCLFGVSAFVIGVLCYRNSRRFFRSIH